MKYTRGKNPNSRNGFKKGNSFGWFKKGHKMMPGSEKGWIKPGHPLYSQWEGKEFTDIHRENISKSHKGQKAWNKGLVGVTVLSEVTREKMASNNNAGWFQEGHPVPFDWYSHFWKGGITPLNKKIRNCKKYINWRSEVFTRDDYTCQECGQRGGKINANHKILFSFIMQHQEIKTFEDAMNCEYLWNIENGETLCEKCHQTLRPNIMKCPKTLTLNL
ncbi:MAG: NUMOD3 domain-containing DNA-binding protein [Nanoarchaeota archaeon]|mgnify:CR=1 FL=1